MKWNVGTAHPWKPLLCERVVGYNAFVCAKRADYEDGFAWYQERSERAAVKFEEAIDVALSEIAKAPGRWPLYDARHRSRLLRRYPYRVVYRVESDLVVVVAIAQAKRSPRFWAGRG